LADLDRIFIIVDND
jgi:hypothetical protein